jgi:methyltransferase (TIGR00027 family)
MRLPSGVGWTSFITAYARAQETRRAHPRFSDHWAGRFLAAFRQQSGVRIGPAAAGSEIWAFFDAYVSGRTPFYDAHLRSTVAAGCRQIVLLAAGLDTRPLRLDIPPDVAVFEVDSAPVLYFKQQILGWHGRSVPVAADLRGDWLPLLLDAGFDPREPTAWLAEGLLMYLDKDDADTLLDTVTKASAPGSSIASESATRNLAAADFALTEPGDIEVCGLMLDVLRAGPGPKPGRWLAEHGWQPEVIDLYDLLCIHGGPIPAQLDKRNQGAIGIWLLTGVR